MRRRWSDDQRQWGPFTVSRSNVYKWGIVLDSGGNEDEPPACHLRFYCPWGVLLVELPQIVQPYRERHRATNWDAATIKRLGRDWYDIVYPCEYGITLSDGHLSVGYGQQTHDSSTEKRWGCFLPWTQWRSVRYSLYDLEGEHFWTEAKPPKGAKRWRGLQSWDVKKLCPAAVFKFEDYDGARITARTVIEEREWRFGTGWFRWLKWCRRRKIRRSLDIDFSAEVGPEKGSWKGGTVGSGIDMLPGELHEQAFKRYCAIESRRKPVLIYLGRVEEIREAASDCQAAKAE